MSVLPILRWPDPRLAQVCAPVGDPAAVEALIGDMFETMYDAPGRGLAAPQVGVMQRVFVMDAGWKEGEMEPLACIDPEILEASEETVTRDEGCLSIPGILVAVTRPARVVLGFTDLTGARQELALDGFAAACAQHELDHLDGRVTFDHLEATARAQKQAAFEALS